MFLEKTLCRVFLAVAIRCVFFGGEKMVVYFLIAASWMDVFFDGETWVSVFFHTFELFDTMHAIVHDSV